MTELSCDFGAGIHSPTLGRSVDEFGASFSSPGYESKSGCTYIGTGNYTRTILLGTNETKTRDIAVGSCQDSGFLHRRYIGGRPMWGSCSYEDWCCTDRTPETYSGDEVDVTAKPPPVPVTGENYVFPWWTGLGGLGIVLAFAGVGYGIYHTIDHFEKKTKKVKKIRKLKN